MQQQDEYAIHCPYCGEPLAILVDPSEPQQEYIEDCQVCCQPMVITIQQDWQGQIEVSARSENDA